MFGDPPPAVVPINVNYNASFVIVVANAFPFSLWGLVIALVDVAFVGVEFASRSDFVLSTQGLAGGGSSEVGTDATMLSIAT